jgi:hypothetical protein
VAVVEDEFLLRSQAGSADEAIDRGSLIATVRPIACRFFFALLLKLKPVLIIHMAPP